MEPGQMPDQHGADRAVGVVVQAAGLGAGGAVLAVLLLPKEKHIPKEKRKSDENKGNPL